MQMHPHSPRSRRLGFTIIELLVVVSIIALLSVLGLISFAQAGKLSRDGKRKSDLENVKAALVIYRADQNTYPVASCPATAANYTAMLSTIANYINNPPASGPKNDTYSYCSDGQVFTLTATLESPVGPYTINNP